MFEHDAKLTCCAICFVKCSWFVELTWNLTCLILACNVIFELWFDIFTIFYHCFRHMNIWCDNLCHIFDVAFVHFHTYAIWAPLDLIFGMMLVHNMTNSHKNVHDHWMFFCFDWDFLIWMSNCVHFACPCFTLINWGLCFMNWSWSFWGHFLVLFEGASCEILISVLVIWLAFDLGLCTCGLYTY